MTGNFIREIKPMVQGVHIMPMGWTDIVPQILEYAEIEVNKG
jgi:methylenetetrahydrofolate reductase (NADPH)